MFFGREKGEGEKRGRHRAIRSVLVVEDEPLVAFDNEYVLVQAGYRVAATVNDFDQAIAVIDRDDVDLIIADIRLQGDKTGLDVARHAHAGGLPVLLVTGACPVDARPLALGCLAKPHAPRDLLAAIGVVDALLRSAPMPRMPAGLHLFRRDAA